MRNFAVGPVLMDKKIRKIGAKQLPYFRTKEFSDLVLKNEALIKKFFNAPQNSRAVFLTASGTGAMEAAVINFFDKNDKILIVNGGSFGKRFAQICSVHGLNYTEIIPEFGCSVTEEQLSAFDGKGYTGFLVNMHETSIGVLYDMKIISEFCKRNGVRLVVDAISSFIADDTDMSGFGADIVITGSQKALAVPPGLAIMVLSEYAVQKIKNNDVESFYFDLKQYLADGERGQTPFTPAVGVLIQLNKRLQRIDKVGFAAEREKIFAVAKDFRARIKAFPFEFVSKSPSNAVTCLSVKEGVSAKAIFETLKNDYGIFICPNGGSLADKVFRVGHIGDLTRKDNTALLKAFKKLQKRGII